MHLTSYTDYSLRLLMYLGAQPSNKLSNIKEISKIYGISNNHLSKIVNELGRKGIVTTIRGRNGGIKLTQAPKDINIGWVVRQTEENLDMAECFNKETNKCIITPSCKLKNVLKEALNAYMKVLDSYTLEDVLGNKDYLQEILQMTSREI